MNLLPQTIHMEPQRTAALELAPEQFREIGHRLVDQLADFLAGLPSRPVTRAETPAQIREAMGAARPLPEDGADPAVILKRAADLVLEHSLFNGHPRFFGYITSSAAPIGALGELVAAVVNANAGAWNLAPIATEIEAQVVRWIAEFIGYPSGGAGILVSGGNMANFVGLLAARASAGGNPLRQGGIGAAPGRLRCYCSVATHTWIQKAADLSGLGTDSIRWISCDTEQRICLEELRRQIRQDRAAGEHPFLVVGTAGSVSTGAVDALPQLAAICAEERIWFHVDGAYGGLAANVPGAPADLRGLALADSVAVDPHKWLYAPLEAGCILVRNKDVLLNTFSYHPPYYSFDAEAINYFDLGPQNSRGFRALKIWLAFQQAGRRGYLQTIADDIELAKRAFDLFDAHPEFEAFSRSLSICTFRYVPQPLRTTSNRAETEALLNELNQELLKATERSGAAFLSNAVLDGKYLLRMCVVNFRTTAADIDVLPGLLAELGARTLATRTENG